MIVMIVLLSFVVKVLSVLQAGKWTKFLRTLFVHQYSHPHPYPHPRHPYPHPRYLDIIFFIITIVMVISK